MTTLEGEPFSLKLERALLQLGGGPPLQDPGACHDGKDRQCRVCWASRYDYAREQEAKSRALEWLWRDVGAPGPMAPFMASPVGRQYRSVSKRKVVGGRLVLLDPVGDRLRPLAVRLCDVEPRPHNAIFATLQRVLGNSPLANALQYVIVKSSAESLVVILNLSRSLPAKFLNAASKKLTEAHPLITGILSVEGQADDNYYLDQNVENERKIFGHRDLRSKIAGKGFQYSAFSFSQVNPWMVEPMLKTVDSFLDPQGAMLDLYCGFGLFALGLPGTRPTLGIELSRASVEAAQQNARHQNARHCRFVSRNISGETLHSSLKGIVPVQAILDPPRGGPSPDLIENLAPLGLKRIVHLICNVDRLDTDLRAWAEAGYGVDQAVALDMFPGSANLEIVLALSPKERKSKPPNPAVLRSAAPARPAFRQRRISG